MSASTTNDQEILTRALGATDAARRVGWAKAYDAEERVNGLLAEVMKLESERSQYRRAFAVMVGFARQMAGTNIENSKAQRRRRFVIKDLIGQFSAIADEAALRSGAEEANRLIDDAWRRVTRGKVERPVQDIATRERARGARGGYRRGLDAGIDATLRFIGVEPDANLLTRIRETELARPSDDGLQQ